jgi:hypothetical protein
MIILIDYGPALAGPFYEISLEILHDLLRSYIHVYSVVVFQRKKMCFISYTHLVFICDTGLYIIYFLWQQETQIMVHVFNI